MSQNPARVLFLDGLRGWSCIAVILQHAHLHVPFHGAAYDLLSLVRDGTFSVSLFFIISGYSIAASCDGNVPLKAAARIPRLLLPVLFAVLLGWAVDVNINPLGILYYPFCIYANSFMKTDSVLMGVPNRSFESYWVARRFGQMWTMTPEVVGSMLIYVWKLLQPRLRRPRLVAACAVTTFAVSNFHLIFFAYGAALQAGAVRVTWRPQLVGAVALAASLAFRCIHFPQNVAGGLLCTAVRCVSAAMVMFGVENVVFVRWLLESRPSLYLGKLSFTMYIYHNIAQYILFDYAPYSNRSPEAVYANHSPWHAFGTLGLTLLMSSILFHVEVTCNRLSKQLAASLFVAQEAIPSEA